MFIYNPEIKHEEISSLTSTINIYPMINNLFKLESPYFYASYDPLSSEESYLTFSDYTYFDGKSFYPLTNDFIERVNISKDILISDFYN